MSIQKIFSSTKKTYLPGPASSRKPPLIYEPVDCHFTDELEFLVIRKWSVSISYIGDNFTQNEVVSVVKDIFIKNKEEFIALSNGQNIRLDKLISLSLGQNIEDHEKVYCSLDKCTINKN